MNVVLINNTKFNILAQLGWAASCKGFKGVQKKVNRLTSSKDGSQVVKQVIVRNGPVLDLGPKEKTAPLEQHVLKDPTVKKLVAEKKLSVEYITVPSQQTTAQPIKDPKPEPKKQVKKETRRRKRSSK
jgi:hypothetical protein